MIKTDEFLELSRVIQNLDDERKNINKDILERFKMAEENFGMTKESLRSAVTEHHKYLKDPTKYTIIDTEVANILKDVILGV